MNQTLRAELGAGVRVCRVCGAPFIGHGALCEIHAAELAAAQRAERQASEAVTAQREAKERAERIARGRREWVEAVDVTREQTQAKANARKWHVDYYTLSDGRAWVDVVADTREAALEVAKAQRPYEFDQAIGAYALRVEGT